MAFTFDHVWATVLTLAAAVLSWLHLGHRREMDAMRKDVDEAQREAAEVRTDLGKHQLYAAETYARRPDVEKAMEQSERRIMARLDEIREEIRGLKPQH